MKHFFTKDTISEYSTNSLFKHYLKWLFGILLIPFLLFYTILFLYSLRSNEDAFRANSTEVLSRSVTVMDNLFEAISKNYESICSDESISLFFLDGFFQNNNASEIYSYSRLMSDHLSSICTSLNYLDSIHIYSVENDYFMSSSNSNYRPYFYDNECFNIYKKCTDNNYILMRRKNNGNAVTLCYVVNNGSKNVGAVFFNINISKLMPTLIGQSTVGACLIFAESDGSTITASDGIFDRDISKCTDGHFGVYKINKTPKNVYMSTRILYENINLIYCVTRKVYYTAFYPFIANNLMYLLFTVLALILLSVAGTFKLYTSISNALSYIETPSSDANTYDEFVFFTKNMMSRVDGNNESESTLALKIKQLKKYQALALQTQINPHFLFNSLNLISSFALDSGGEDSPLVVIVDKLSDILRFCLNTKNYIIKIEEELNATIKYIEIENIKHDNMIDFRFFIDKELYEYYTLKMILQPLIENAITHGVKLLRHKQGVVKIIGRLRGQTVSFSIMNNGPQINPEKLADLQEALLCEEEIPENNHIGLKNVNQRIKLIFGNDYGCTIDSDSEYTTVTVSFPIIRKNNNDFM